MIDDQGGQVGVVSMPEAFRMAREKGLDLVEISPTATPPVVKIIDYGKYKYELQKKAAEAKKKQIVADLKEIQLRPNIDEHDLATKLKKVDQFLLEGDKVKLVMQFKGREMAYAETGMKKFRSILETIFQLGGVVEAEPKMMGNRIISILNPDKAVIQKRLTLMQKQNTNKNTDNV